MNSVRALACGLVVLLHVSPSPAQTVPEYGQQFLDFGVPCADPHEEIRGPAILNGNKSGPISNPATPLTPPPYPPLARQMGEEGRAILRLLVSESGVVSKAYITESSGSPRLDSAALEEMRNWRLTPGMVDGKPRCMWGEFAVTFKLTDYTSEELQRASVTPEAQTLAALIVGVDELRQMLVRNFSETEKKIVDLTIETARKRKEWVDVHDRVARMLAIEFTQDELKELGEFFSRPVASKWRMISFKMARTLLSEQGLVSDTLFCTLARVNLGMDEELQDFSSESSEFTEAHSLAITRFVDQAIPYCACQRRALSAPGTARKMLDICGLPPRLVEP